jgi:hypothetical protein
MAHMIGDRDMDPIRMSLTAGSRSTVGRAFDVDRASVFPQTPPRNPE